MTADTPTISASAEVVVAGPSSSTDVPADGHSPCAGSSAASFRNLDHILSAVTVTVVDRYMHGLAKDYLPDSCPEHQPGLCLGQLLGGSREEDRYDQGPAGALLAMWLQATCFT